MFAFIIPLYLKKVIFMAWNHPRIDNRNLGFTGVTRSDGLQSMTVAYSMFLSDIDHTLSSSYRPWLMYLLSIASSSICSPKKHRAFLCNR